MRHALQSSDEPVGTNAIILELAELKRSLWNIHVFRYSVQIALLAEIWIEAQRASKCGAAAALGFCLMGELRDWKFRKRERPQMMRDFVVSTLAKGAALRVLLGFFAFNVVRELEYHNSLFWPIVSLWAFVLLLKQWLESEALVGRLAQVGAAPSASPPHVAELFLYFVLPRREREPLLGDLNEDFATNVLPKFGPLYARGWYWYKTILYVWMYTCENAIEPFIRRVIEPLWRQVVLPMLKWIIAPALVVHKLSWVDAIRAYLDKFR